MLLRSVRRDRFIAKWYQRASAEEDPFDKFFSLWITLVVAAARWHNLRGSTVYDQTDREKIVEYLQGHRERVLVLLKPGINEIRQLARRKGINRGNPILDTGSKELQEKFQKFAEHYVGKRSLGEDELLNILAEILNKVRNNVLHGNKIYDDKDDIGVLKLVNPILVAVLQNCEPELLGLKQH